MKIEIENLTYREFTELKKKFSKIGRPKKYKTKAEAKDAQRQQSKKWHQANDRRFYLIKKARKALKNKGKKE